MTRSSALRLSKSIVGTREADALRDVVLDDGYLGMGKQVHAFEVAIQKYLGTTRSVTCVNTGTSALHLAVAACVPAGGEVLIQSLTFVGSFMAITGAGAVPVACEVDPETAMIDLKDAERKLTPKTKAIMPVHYASNPGDMDAVYAFAKRHNLRVIEDAAHSFGCRHKGQFVGTFGDVTCFSFDGIKNITCGEGGAVVTADEGVAQYVRDARLLGIQRDTEKRYAGQRSWEFDVEHQGYRYHMSNLFAAIGLVQLDRFESEFKPKRQALSAHYLKLLADLPQIRPFPCDDGAVIRHIFPVRVGEGLRDKLRAHLIDNKIECGIHYYPSHVLSFFGAKRGQLPVTEALYDQLLTLPLHPDLSFVDVEYVVDTMRAFFRMQA